MKRIPRVLLKCSVCEAPAERRVPEARSESFCGQECQGIGMSRRIVAAKRAQCLDRRSVLKQPDSYRLIGLSKGKFARVDICDFGWLSCTIWRLNDGGYAVCDADPRRMQRAVMQMKLQRKLENWEQIDHDNGDRLDNRRDNLRIASNQENGFNKKATAGTSRYKGVAWSKQRRRWYARIKLNGRGQHLGFYDEELDAATAYDCAAIQLFGEYAWLNLIGR